MLNRKMLMSRLSIKFSECARLCSVLPGQCRRGGRQLLWCVHPERKTFKKINYEIIKYSPLGVEYGKAGQLIMRKKATETFCRVGKKVE
jgi:hypothetical protein